ncbi:MAG TPA: lysophospholipid acyltransferase family protein [Nitrospira sp.]|nr:lysophospholipid acyltransferase family protein [Nitrospira sp.]
MRDSDRHQTRWGKRIETWLKLSVVPPVGAWIIRGLGRSMRLETRGQDQVDALYRQGQRVIIAFWHARQLMMPLTYRGTGAHILISHHRDGEIIARIVERFGFRTVRGSSTRGGVEALRELIRLGRAGVDLVVTPDGPKGPAQVVKMGVIQLARASGLPIVPLTFGCSKKKSSRVGIASWCRIRRHEASSSGARLFGCRGRRMTRSSRPSGWRWKPS